MNIQITALIELFIFYQTAYKKEIHSEIYIGRLLARQYRQELQSQEVKEWWCLCIMEQYVIVWFYAIFSKSSFTAQMDPQLCSMLSYTQRCVIISYRVVSILFSPRFVAPNPFPKLFKSCSEDRMTNIGIFMTPLSALWTSINLFSPHPVSSGIL